LSEWNSSIFGLGVDDVFIRTTDSGRRPRFEDFFSDFEMGLVGSSKGGEAGTYKGGGGPCVSVCRPICSSSASLNSIAPVDSFVNDSR